MKNSLTNTLLFALPVTFMALACGDSVKDCALELTCEAVEGDGDAMEPDDRSREDMGMGGVDNGEGDDDEPSDPCAEDNGGCDELTTCTSTDEGVECGECPDWYSGDGQTGCTAIPPQILSIVPADGSTGVRADDPVIIEFSQRMNTAAVEGAVSISSLLPSNLNFDWNDESTVLTINVEPGFAYATGSNAAGTSARGYTINVVDDAENSVGAPLRMGASSTFSTLKRITRRIPSEEVGYRGTYVSGGSASMISCSGSNAVSLGFVSSSATIGFILFNSSSLESNVVEVEDVSFRASQTSPTGSFYPSGSVVLRQLEYQPLSSITGTVPNGTVLGTLATSAAQATPTVDVTSAFVSDYQDGLERFLFRINGSNGPEGTYARFLCNGFALDVQYLIP